MTRSSLWLHRIVNIGLVSGLAIFIFSLYFGLSRDNENFPIGNVITGSFLITLLLSPLHIYLSQKPGVKASKKTKVFGRLVFLAMITVLAYLVFWTYIVRSWLSDGGSFDLPPW